MTNHLKAALSTGPVTKFSGLNSVKMIGDNFRFFFGENPSRVLITFFLINVPATLLNTTVATVSSTLIFDKFCRILLFGTALSSSCP